MPVVSENRVVGIISRSEFVRVPLMMNDWQDFARDELKRAGPAGLDTESNSNVKTKSNGYLNLVMPSQVVVCSPDTPLSTVASEMIKRHIHRVVVVDSAQLPIGIVSSLDIVKLHCDETFGANIDRT